MKYQLYSLIPGEHALQAIGPWREFPPDLLGDPTVEFENYARQEAAARQLVMRRDADGRCGTGGGMSVCHLPYGPPV